MGVLYRLTFSSGKAYIGITRRSLSSRMVEHRKRLSGCRPNEKFAVYEAWRKYGEPIAEILAVLEDHDLAAAEIEAIKHFRTLSPHGYNLTLGGDGVRTGREISEATREKLRQANLGKKQSPETKNKRAAALKGKTPSEETRRKIGEKNKINSLGKTHSAATRALISTLSKGRTHTVSDEAKAKMRAAKLGKPQTPETIEKRRAAMLGRRQSPETIEKLKKAHTGKVIPEEAKAKMSAAKKGKPWSAARREAHLTASTTRIN